jgi:hypothetical protein
MADEDSLNNLSSPSSNGADDRHSHPDRRSRFLLGVLFVLASPFLVDAPAIKFSMTIHGDSILIPIFVGFVVAKFGLLAMWLGWGGSRAIWRMLILAVSWFFTCALIPGSYSDAAQAFAVIYLLLVITAAFIAVPRLFGVRWIASSEDSAAVLGATHHAYQFSIFDLLVWTTTTAILAALVRVLGLPQVFDVETVFFMCLACAMLIVGTLTAMWAQLAELAAGPSVAARAFITFALALVMAIVIAAISQAPSDAVGYIFALFLTIAACLLGACYCLRRQGQWIVWRKSPNRQVPTA